MNSFHERMVLVSRPYCWDAKAQGAWRDLLDAVLARGQPGTAAWGLPVALDESVTVPTVVKTQPARWLKALPPFPAEPATEPGDPVVELWSLGTMFATGARVKSLLPIDSARLEEFRAVMARTYLSLELNVVRVDEREFLLPQLRLSDYWPANRQFAPASSRAGNTQAQDAARTAHVLNHDLWHVADDAVQAIMKSRGIEHVKPDIDDYQFRSPAFYFASPVEPPSSPDRYLSYPSLGPVRVLCRDTIGSEDPRSEQVSGFLAEGSVVVLRRQFVFPIEAPQYRDFRRKRTESHYLCLAWHASGQTATTEWAIAFTALRLSLLDIRTVLRLQEPAAALRKQSSEVKSDSDGLQERNRKTEKFLAQAAAATKRRDEKACYAALGELADRELRLRPKLIAAVRHVDDLGRRVSQVIDEAASTAERALTFRSVRGLTPLTGELLRSSPPARVAREQFDTAKLGIAAYSDASEKLSATIDAVVELERREAERISATRQQLLGLLLAGLAGVTALSLIVGQINPDQIEDAVTHVGVRAAPAKFLAVDLHDEVIVFGILASAFLILALAVYFAYVATGGPRRWRRAKGDQLLAEDDGALAVAGPH